MSGMDALNDDSDLGEPLAEDQTFVSDDTWVYLDEKGSIVIRQFDVCVKLTPYEWRIVVDSVLCDFMKRGEKP